MVRWKPTNPSVPSPTAEPVDPRSLSRPGAGGLVQPLRDGALRCLACGQYCSLKEGRRGACQVRHREEGAIRVPWGYVGQIAVDPVERKPFFHVLPGRDAFSFGMLGCNFHCPYCQQWSLSQYARDSAAHGAVTPVSAEALADMAVQRGCRLMVATYNEPFVAAEWVCEVFGHARQRGLICGLVSNGYASPHALAHVATATDAIKIDLKAMDDRVYRRLGGTLSVVTECIRRAHAMGLWLEVVTLVVPGLNDDADQLSRTAAFLAGVSLDLPWHVTAFHPDYAMTGIAPTRLSTLTQAVAIGRNHGLRHVYSSHSFGAAGAENGTACRRCGQALIVRRGFAIASNIMRDGACPDCGLTCPGIWEASPPRARQPHLWPLPLKSC